MFLDSEMSIRSNINQPILQVSVVFYIFDIYYNISNYRITVLFPKINNIHQLQNVLMKTIF